MVRFVYARSLKFTLADEIVNVSPEEEELRLGQNRSFKAACENSGKISVLLEEESFKINMKISLLVHGTSHSAADNRGLERAKINKYCVPQRTVHARKSKSIH